MNEYWFLYRLALCQHIQCTRWVINVFWKSLCSWSSNTPLLAFVPLGCNCVLIVREVMIVRDLLLQLANPIQCTLGNAVQLLSFCVLSKMWYTHACLVVSVKRVAWKIDLYHANYTFSKHWCWSNWTGIEILDRPQIQTWDLSKILPRQIFRPKILHL